MYMRKYGMWYTYNEWWLLVLCVWPIFMYIYVWFVVVCVYMYTCTLYLFKYYDHFVVHVYRYVWISAQMTQLPVSLTGSALGRICDKIHLNPKTPIFWPGKVYVGDVKQCLPLRTLRPKM